MSLALGGNCPLSVSEPQFPACVGTAALAGAGSHYTTAALVLGWGAGGRVLRGQAWPSCLRPSQTQGELCGCQALHLEGPPGGCSLAGCWRTALGLQGQQGPPGLGFFLAGKAWTLGGPGWGEKGAVPTSQRDGCP